MPHSLLNQPKILLEQIINNALDAFIVIDEDSIVVAWSRQAEVLFGWSDQEAAGSAITDLIIPPDLRIAHRAGMRRFLETGERRVLDRRIEIFAQHRNGDMFPVELSITDLSVDGRRLFSAALRDITQRLEIEEQFRATFEQAAVGIVHFTPDKKVLRMNQKLCDIVGYSKDELLSIASWELTLAEDRGVEVPHIEAVWSGNAGSRTYEKRFIRKDGEVIWAEVTISLLRTAAGLPKYLIAVIDDITGRKRVQEQAERLAAVIEATPDFVGFGSTKGEVLYINQAGRRMIGLADDQRLHGIHILTKYPQWARQRVEHGIQVALSEGSWRGESAVLAADGTELPVSQVIVAHGTQDGKSSYLSTILRDISDRKQKENALEEADRRKDEFLAMLAHELRNPLAPISTAAQLLKFSGLAESKIRHASDVIARQVAHMTGLIDDLLDLSRVTRGLITIAHEPVELRNVVADAVEQVRDLIALKNHQLVVSPISQKIWLTGDRTRLVQVLANLLSNAARYTPEGGRVEVTVVLQESMVDVIVRDNGVGIDASLLPQVFELFVQGKRSPDRAQGGLGLGLALVKSLVEMHGGRVSAQSGGIGHGCQFTIQLPCSSV